MKFRTIIISLFLTAALIACQRKNSHARHNHAAGKADEHQSSSCKKGDGHDHNHADGKEHDHEHVNEGHAHDANEHSKSDIEHHHHDEDFAFGDEIIIAARKAAAAGIQVEELKPRDFNHVINCSGRLVAPQGREATAVAPSSGVVRFERSCTEGVHIGKGERLVGIAVNATAQNDPLREAQIAYEAAKREYERIAPLAESKIVTAAELARSQETYQLAKLRYESLSKLGKGGIQEVLAPISGYIKSVLVQEGDYVQQGQALMQISQNKELVLRAEVGERYFEDLSQVRTANFKTAYSDQVYQLDSLSGKLLSVGQTAGANSFFVPVTFSFLNKNNLLAGSLVEVQLLCRPKSNCLVLTRTALSEEEGQFFVYVRLDAEGYKKQKVSLGQSNGKEVVILEGLEAGDQVVTKGSILVKLSSATATIPAHTH